MDGLLIAEQLALLAERLPSARGAWRFLDDRTFVLPLTEGASLTLAVRPPEPRLEVSIEPERRVDGDGKGRSSARPHTPFQAQVAARATGDLIAVFQPALDRVARLSFAEGAGFVPEPPIDLIVELTGRNANLILVDRDDRIVGAQRVVTTDRNRHREVRIGSVYAPPPPYVKLDPRGVERDVLRATLAGRPVRDVRRTIDGVGPQLYAALVGRADLRDEAAPLAGDDLERAVTALQQVVAAPSAALRDVKTGLALESAADRQVAAQRSALERRLAKRLQVAEKRVADARLTIDAADEAPRMRGEADLLLANVAGYVPVGDAVELVGFDGEPVRLTVDPTLDAAGNAALRYARARRREARAAKATERLPALSEEVAELRSVGAAIATADAASLKAVEERLAELEPRVTQSRSANREVQKRPPGARFVDPRGYEVLVGRSAKENDAITFTVAKSRDVWLHVQGYQGAHVLVRSQGREVPFDTVLFAARLAAGFSRAKDSDNVPVDYTQRKNVWRVKGAAPGAVNIAHQKTVYVTPARDDAGASDRGS